MRKLAIALLFIAATPPVAFAEPVKSGAPGKAGHGTRNAVKKVARKTDAETVTRKGAPPVAASESKGMSNRRPDSKVRAKITFPSGETLAIIEGRHRTGQEHYDPNRSGNPLLDTSGANRLKMLSDNFSVYEFARSGEKTFGVARIDPRQVTCLQSIRDYVGRPVRIGSGYRSFWYNIEVYRRKAKEPTKSQHISGKASDIMIEGMTGLEIAKAAIDACGPNVSVGLGLWYAHIDVRGESRTWKYKGVPNQQIAEVDRHRTAARLSRKRREKRAQEGRLPKRV